MNGADRWLHEELQAIRNWRSDSLDDAVAESLERAQAGLDALEAAGAVPTAVAARWRDILVREAAGEVRVAAHPEVRGRAERYLAELLGTLRPDRDPDDRDLLRFEASLHLLSACGVIDGPMWDAKLRERVGWPSQEEERAEELALNARGTEAELVDVIPGPDEVHRGHRLLLVLRFADGVSCVIDNESPVIDDGSSDDDWPDWELIDDLGTSYAPRGGGGSDETEHISFGTPIPADATWLQLRVEHQADVSFRVSLD